MNVRKTKTNSKGQEFAMLAPLLAPRTYLSTPLSLTMPTRLKTITVSPHYKHEEGETGSI